MKTNHYLALVAVIAGLASPQATADHVRPGLPPQVLQGMRGAAYAAARACDQFYSTARRVPVRTRQGGETLAAILRLRDASRHFAEATTSSYWPRPDWLRMCSERLLDSWIYVERILRTVPAPPPVLTEWSRAQGGLAALYRTAEPYIGRPSGGPLPAALAASQGQPPGVVRALPARPEPNR
ncbi:MAG: hypothetical protein HZA91_15650 [Verrucomicrobia bacterium]|nr:hypothetical protein [Verrucomicrobiota bacterium]